MKLRVFLVVREILFRWSWVDYTTLHPGALRFVPPAHLLDAWRKDYQEMRGEMFFGEVPSSDVLKGIPRDCKRREPCCARHEQAGVQSHPAENHSH
jgi:hypothetical protein